MTAMTSRRDVLKIGALAIGALGCGGRGRAGGRPSASAPPAVEAPAPIDASLVELIETAEREQLLERLVPRLTPGVTPAALLAALRVAATRHVVPRKSFSKEHHALLCGAAVQVLADHLPARHRWHPALWAVDYFKWAQAELAGPTHETLAPLAASQLPPAGAAARAFEDAIEAFDGARAEAAIAALERAGRRDAAIELLLRYGSRDFRHIGHKAIYVSSSLRAFDALGWHGGEDVLRSIALTLALHYTDPNRDLDGAWPKNLAASATLGPDWHRGAEDPGAVVELLGVLRSAAPDDAAAAVAAVLRRGVSPRSAWDAMFASGAELMFNHPTGIEALHAVTASNAAYSAFQRTRDDATRRLLLLQNAGRVADFHRYAAHWAVKRGRPPMFQLRIEELEPLAPAPGEPLADIFAEIGGEPAARLRAAQKTLAYLAADPAHARRFAAHAAGAVTARATDTHDLKLLAAAIEDHDRVSPAWRARYLAACTARLRGTAEPLTPIGRRIDEAARAIAPS
jgi:hypothetical protein